ncbi:hypothetical protein ACXX9E_29445 [Pseudomonas sp. GNP014]
MDTSLALSALWSCRNSSQGFAITKVPVVRSVQGIGHRIAQEAEPLQIGAIWKCRCWSK